MDPSRPPFVFPPWSFASPSRPGAREPTVSAMLGELASACGLLRRKSMRAMFAEARKIDALVEELELDSPEPDENPSSASPRPAAPRRGRSAEAAGPKNGFVRRVNRSVGVRPKPASTDALVERHDGPIAVIVPRHQGGGLGL